MRSSRPLTAVAVLLATALAGVPALSSPADAGADRDRDSVSAAADRYGISDAELRAMLEADPSLRVSGAGVYYVDPAPRRVAEGPTVIGQAFPLADTFSLHSKPGSQRTIYLDFNGEVVNDTWWNVSQQGSLANGSHPAWTLDGDPSTFNDAERMLIQDVFQRVAEDYAPFDVDVTTQDPGTAAIIRTDPSDQVYGTRALISPSEAAIEGICGGNCGGVAFLDVFDIVDGTGIAQPAWVFPQALSNNAKYIADATTHEVGHNFSLMHDGTTDLGYYSGHGDLWGPIMGAPYDVPITQFGLNEYPGAKLGGPDGDPDGWQSNADDLATINGSGALFRTDEPGNSIATAGAIPAGGGVISSRTDVDYYNLGTCSGNVTVTANNAEVSPNLDIELQLLTASSTVLDTDNPAALGVTYDDADGLDAQAAANVAAGTYYVRVDGIGAGNALTSYNDYGSAGAYTLQVTGCGLPSVTEPSVPQNLGGLYQGDGIVVLDWDAPASNGGGAITQYNIYEDGVLIGDVTSLGANIGQVPPGVHDYGVAAVNSAGEGPQAHVTVDATDPDPEAVPGRAQIGQAKQGRRGGALTATVSWLPPSGTTNPAIDGFEFIAYKQNRRGKYVRVFAKEFNQVFASVKYTTSRRGLHKFAVRAHNALGYGPVSAKSNAVSPR